MAASKSSSALLDTCALTAPVDVCLRPTFLAGMAFPSYMLVGLLRVTVFEHDYDVPSLLPLPLAQPFLFLFERLSKGNASYFAQQS
jgi:hypothetical protein